MTDIEDCLSNVVKRWIQTDPETRWKQHLQHLAQSADPEDQKKLEDLFDGRIGFGTAGLRSRVGPGPKHMNAQVVRQSTAGLMNWLKKRCDCAEQGDNSPTVAIGFDARRDSAEFAQHCAATVLACGGQILLADQPLATPICAHAGLIAKSDATVVITASHNPKDDNGYKLYLSDGIQLVNPTDQQIGAEIDSVLTNWENIDPEISAEFERRGSWQRESAQVWTTAHRDAFLHRLEELAGSTEAKNARKDLTVAYSAMHGVGAEAVIDVFNQAGFKPIHSVAEQHEPDPEFSTVSFPNPEEDGAIDMAVALGVEVQADLILVNDPDADRLAVAIPGRNGENYVMLSGNELAMLLADYLLETTSDKPSRVVARSVVSSRLLDHLAKAHGVSNVVSLTGFKWVARPIVDYPQSSYVFGFEEAIGYCVSDHVRDKDGISAAVVAAQAVAELKANDKTVWQRFDEIAEKHGVFESSQIVVRFDSSEKLATVVNRIKEQGLDTIAGSKVVKFGDLGLGSLPPSTGLHMVTECDSQIIIRPSGTEPKIKTYIEVHEPRVTDQSSVQVLRSKALQRLKNIEIDIDKVLKTAL